MRGGGDLVLSPVANALHFNAATQRLHLKQTIAALKLLEHVLAKKKTKTKGVRSIIHFLASAKSCSKV